MRKHDFIFQIVVRAERIYTTGCVRAFDDWIKIHSRTVFGVLIGLALCQVTLYLNNVQYLLKVINSLENMKSKIEQWNGEYLFANSYSQDFVHRVGENFTFANCIKTLPRFSTGKFP